MLTISERTTQIRGAILRLAKLARHAVDRDGKRHGLRAGDESSLHLSC
jgi:hypothetical protein